MIFTSGGRTRRLRWTPGAAISAGSAADRRRAAWRSHAQARAGRPYGEGRHSCDRSRRDATGVAVALAELLAPAALGCRSRSRRFKRQGGDRACPRHWSRVRRQHQLQRIEDIGARLLASATERQSARNLANTRDDRAGLIRWLVLDGEAQNLAHANHRASARCGRSAAVELERAPGPCGGRRWRRPGRGRRRGRRRSRRIRTRRARAAGADRSTAAGQRGVVEVDGAVAAHRGLRLAARGAFHVDDATSLAAAVEPSLARGSAAPVPDAKS